MLEPVSPTFPAHVLEGTESAACFFCAAFHGRNVESTLAAAGIARVVCVDISDQLLREMAEDFPPSWDFRNADAWEEAARMRKAGEAFDLVTLDPWTGDIPRVLETLDEFRPLAKRWLVVGLMHDSPDPPGCVERVKRSDYRGGVYWGVIPCA